jgi:YggT family protein
MPLLFALATLIINALIAVLFATALLSWFPIDPRNRWVRLLHAIADPVIYPIRAIVPPIGGFSLDVFIAILLLQLIKSVLSNASLS